MKFTAFAILALFLTACGGGTSSQDDDILDSEGKADGLSKPIYATYEIISGEENESVTPRYNLLTLKNDGTFFAQLATKPYDWGKGPNEQQGLSVLSGSYQFTKTARGDKFIRFLDEAGSIMNKFQYTISKNSLVLTNSDNTRFAMDPSSHFMCQSSEDCTSQGVPACSDEPSCDLSYAADFHYCGCGDLTEDWISQVQDKYYEDLNNNEIDQYQSVNRKDLPKNAQLRYDLILRDWSDYPPKAYTMEVEDNTVFVVSEENDGGMYVYLFDQEGWVLGIGSASESGDFSW